MQLSAEQSIYLLMKGAQTILPTQCPGTSCQRVQGLVQPKTVMPTEYPCTSWMVTGLNHPGPQKVRTAKSNAELTHRARIKFLRQQFPPLPVTHTKDSAPKLATEPAIQLPYKYQDKFDRIMTKLNCDAFPK